MIKVRGQYNKTKVFTDNIEETMKVRRNDILKVIAILTMLIDHVGLVFFPQYEAFRIIGRIAFPIFAYQLAIGYRHTSNRKKYMFRLWTFALISQIPYTLLFDTYDFNILFTLLLSIILIDQISKGNQYWVPIILFFVTIPKYIDVIPSFEYDWYGILTPILFHWFYNSKEKLLVAQIISLTIYVLVDGWIYQEFAILGILICLYFPRDILKIQLNKYFFYWFYPVHLLVLFIIFQVINK